MSETWCGVCENKNPNCLTCKTARAWEAIENKAIDKMLDRLFQVSYNALEKNIWEMRNESGK